jgi:2-oxoisovalerate dehydrogenase E1 component
VVGADTFTPLAGAAFLVIPSEDDIVAAAQSLAGTAATKPAAAGTKKKR